jgi:hypothetical protein
MRNILDRPDALPKHGSWQASERALSEFSNAGVLGEIGKAIYDDYAHGNSIYDKDMS